MSLERWLDRIAPLQARASVSPATDTGAACGRSVSDADRWKLLLAGDAWQQGGALVVQPGGKVTFRYVSLGPGDHPRPAALLAALKRAA